MNSNKASRQIEKERKSEKKERKSEKKERKKRYVKNEFKQSK